ncbi:NAD(P)/FAD-dependent oxidoreductase [Silvibacterium acidisoli]|uniref:NAD(P)/FAD-dependent oxidoreductase n=1 Tax=Acidobacteriaceae bacterium ZG23-2 TaxID=2883246 RepID=UPI00406C4196
MNQIDIAVVGGGIIGLSAAMELAAAGRQVTVFDRGQPMHEASTAAAGMIAGRDPENPAALQPLSDLSVRLYPEFLRRLEELSGVAVPVRTSRTIQGCHSLPEGSSPIDAAAVASLAPDFVADPSLQFILLEEGSVDPGDLLRSLPVAARALGITLLDNHTVTDIRQETDRVEIATDAGHFTANTIVYATGAWSGDLLGLPIFPRKGQIGMIEAPAAPLLCTIRTPGLYLVPRGDGRIVVGATVEDAGYDTNVDQKIEALIESAATLWPPAGKCRILETWAGLRPGSADQLPVIDRWGDRGYVTAGHFRNGIMLAPGSARVLRQLILGEPVSIDLTAYRCDRFASSSVLTS